MTDPPPSTTTSVYFDNCLVGAVVKGDHPDQSSAISILLRAHERGTIALVASTEVLREIQRLPVRYQGPHRNVWNQLRTLPASRVTWLDPGSSGPSVRTDPLYSRLESILPDHDDRLHVFHAEKQRVQYYATVDYRTILNRKTSLESSVSIRFGKPSEIVAHLGLGPST